MKPNPTLRTKRLVLRYLTLADAPAIQRYAADRDIAANTASIPHPYEDGMAEEWINRHLEQTREGKVLNMGLTLPEEDTVFGVVGLVIQAEHRHAELGYWVAKPFWGKGYATEAAGALLGHGFEALGLERIHAHCFSRNPASARVLRKLGMVREGRLRRHIDKWGELQDIELYGLLVDEFLD